ncbi:S8 family serine peptidase, partial [Patescibacteria group bacterium]|nr:S8 family serine peptidase [Patescibacteria group bacterium]
KANSKANDIAAINQQENTSESYRSQFADFRVLKIPATKTVAEMVEIYTKNPLVEYAEPNFIMHTALVPNDPIYQYQWHFDDDNTINTGGASTNPFGGINGGGIRMEEAWDRSTGTSTVVVAVVDTGVAYEDFPVPSYETSTVASGVTDYQQAPDLVNTNFVAGYDFIHDDTHPNDNNAHGTHVSGTIAQSTNNNLGVAGLAFNTSIMPVKVLDEAGCGTTAGVADGINFATSNGADVINLSLSGGNTTTMENAVANAYNNGVVVVAASGNGGSSSIGFPAAYDSYVIAVGSTRYDEERSTFSNFGSSLDVVAPGGQTSLDQNEDGFADGVLQNTFTAYDDRRPFCVSNQDNPADVTDFAYWFYQGTSMSTPHVAGLAAALLAIDPTLTPDQVRTAIETTAEDKGAVGFDTEYGWGLIDAEAALASVAPTVSITLSTDGTIDFGILGLGDTQDTTASGTIDVQTVTVDTGPVDLYVRSTLYSDNGNSWSLGTTNGADQVIWEFSPDGTGTSWSTFTSANTPFLLASSVSQGASQDAYFRLTMPTSTSSNNQYSSDITIVASSP